MKGKFFFIALSFFILGNVLYPKDLLDARAASFIDGKTLVLYDAASGNLPDKSWMSFTDFPPGGASLTYAEGATVLDTTLAGNDTFAGWVSSGSTTSGFPILDRTTGFQLNFTMQVDRETHGSKNRAGFSIIILDQEARGIELAYWENEIWAQSDENTGELFRHGEGSAFATTNMTEYQLTFVGDTYTLTANSQPLLTGPIRDYSSFEGFPDPYQTPNFLFMGDDTTSSESRVRLRFVSVTGSEPVLPTTTNMAPTELPTPTASLTPLPSVVPLSSPTSEPSHRVVEFCPTGFFMMVVASVVMLKRNRRG